MGLGADDLLGLADPRRALDAHDRGLAEVGGDAVVALERRLDDLLLDLAVERDGDLVPVVVLADVDERILLGELAEGRPQAAGLLGSQREHDGLERRPREARRLGLARGRFADRVADPDRTEAADRRHLPRHEHVAPRRAGGREYLDRRRLRLLPSPDADALARPQRAGEQADVGDALACRRALDLEHAAGDRRLGIAASAREELVDAGEQRVDPVAGRRRPEEHRVDPALPRLRRELLAQVEPARAPPRR